MLDVSGFVQHLIDHENLQNCHIKKTRGNSRVRPRFKGGFTVYLREFDKTDRDSLFIAAHEVAHVINIKNNEKFFNNYWLIRNLIILFGVAYFLLGLERELFSLNLQGGILPTLAVVLGALFFLLSRFYIRDERAAEEVAIELFKKHISRALVNAGDQRSAEELLSGIEKDILKRGKSIIQAGRIMGYVLPVIIIIALI